MRTALLAGTALAAVLALTSSVQAAEQSPTIVKLMTSDVVVDADGLDTRTVHLELTATNEAAAMDVGQTSLAYRESMQELEIVEAYTLKANGQRLPVAPNAIYTQQPQSAPQLQAFDDTRQKVIVFPNVAAGDSVVYTAKWRDKIAAIPGHFTYTEFYSPSAAYNDARGSITAPKSLPLKIENHDVQVEKQETADTVTYRWRYSAPANDMVDYPEVSPLDSLPRVLVTSLASHEELGRTYASLLAPKEAITPRIQALADQVTAGVADRREQAQKIYDWVSKNIRYVAVDIGNGGIIPHEADVTLANGYGDCKDHAVLFAALLKAKGIASEVALINLGNAYTLPDVAMIMPFNHVITWLPEFELYVDTTAGVAPFGTLPFSEYGKPVVHAVGSGGALRRTPALAPGTATLSLKTVARVTDDGKITGDSTVTAAGPYALSLRSTGLAIQGSGPARFAASALDTQGYKGTGFVDVPPPTALEPTYTLKSRFEYMDSDISAGMAFHMIRGLWLSGVTGDFLMGSLFEEPQNENEATACYSGRAEEELSVEFPAGTAIGSLPANFEVKTPNLEFRAVWSGSGSTITVRREFISTISEPLCSGEVRKATAKALEEIRDDYDMSTVSYGASEASTSQGDPDIDDASVAYNAGDYVKAIQLLTKALAKPELPADSRHAAILLRGDAHAVRGDRQQAIVDYTEALRLKPDQAAVFNARGAALAAGEQLDRAVADFSQAIRIDPDQPDYYSGRANVFWRQRKFKEASDDYSAIIRLKPDDPLTYVSRAQAYQGDGLYERTIADCDTAIKLGRTAADCYSLRGNAHYFLAKYDESIASFNAAVQAEPENFGGYLGRGLAYLAMNRPELAFADFESTLRYKPNEPGALYGRAVARERRGDQAGAEVDLAAARSINNAMVGRMSGLGVIRGPYAAGTDDLALCKAAVPNRDIYQGTLFCSRALSAAGLSASDKSQAHMFFGTLHRDRRHFDEALGHYDEAIKLNASFAQLYVERGLAYQMNNNLDRAIESYDQAIRIDGNIALAFFNRAGAYRDKGQLDAAIKDLSEAIRANPQYAAAFQNRGLVYADKGQYAQAIEDAGQSVRLRPGNPIPLNTRCWILGNAGKAREAIPDCDMALSIQPNFYEALDSRAYAYLRLQNYAAAIRDFDAALSLKPDLAPSLFGRGVAKIRSGNAADGNADIGAAAKINPAIAETMGKLGIAP